MLVGEFDLLHHLLRSGRAVIKQSESQKRREQQTQKSHTREHGVSVSNERHGLVLRLDTLLASYAFGRGMTTTPPRCNSECRQRAAVGASGTRNTSARCSARLFSNCFNWACSSAIRLCRYCRSRSVSSVARSLQ